jgi:hypothetical protein
MSDYLFQCDPTGPVGETVVVRNGRETVGHGFCYPSGAVDFTFDTALPRHRRHELERLFEDRTLQGKYHPTIETKNADGTKTILMDGTIEIYLI